MIPRAPTREYRICRIHERGCTHQIPPPHVPPRTPPCARVKRTVCKLGRLSSACQWSCILELQTSTHAQHKYKETMDCEECKTLLDAQIASITKESGYYPRFASFCVWWQRVKGRRGTFHRPVTAHNVGQMFPPSPSNFSGRPYVTPRCAPLRRHKRGKNRMMSLRATSMQVCVRVRVRAHVLPYLLVCTDRSRLPATTNP